MRWRIAAMPALNSGWCTDHIWRSNSRLDRVVVGLGAHHLGDGVVGCRRARADGWPPARRAPARGAAARRRGRTATPARARAASLPSSISPNRTMATSPARPISRWSIHVCPPPGWTPSWRKRGVEARALAREADVAGQRQVHPGADGGAVDRGQGRQRRAVRPRKPS